MPPHPKPANYLWEGAMRPIRGHGPLPQDIVFRETAQNVEWTMGCAPLSRIASVK